MDPWKKAIPNFESIIFSFHVSFPGVKWVLKQACKILLVSVRLRLRRQAVKCQDLYISTPGIFLVTTSHDLTPNGGLVRGIPLFQGNLGWWNRAQTPAFAWLPCQLGLRTVSASLSWHLIFRISSRSLPSILWNSYNQRVGEICWWQIQLQSMAQFQQAS